VISQHSHKEIIVLFFTVLYLLSPKLSFNCLINAYFTISLAISYDCEAKSLLWGRDVIYDIRVIRDM
jgi:hypothetical protein